jgi:hypothetical protein
LFLETATLYLLALGAPEVLLAKTQLKIVTLSVLPLLKVVQGAWHWVVVGQAADLGEHLLGTVGVMVVPAVPALTYRAVAAGVLAGTAAPGAAGVLVVPLLLAILE